MIPSVAADFHAAADAIAAGHCDADPLQTTHVLLEIGRAWLDGVESDDAMAHRLRRIAGPASTTQGHPAPKDAP
jgi:hypothetical protein